MTNEIVISVVSRGENRGHEDVHCTDRLQLGPFGPQIPHCCGKASSALQGANDCPSPANPMHLYANVTASEQITTIHCLSHMSIRMRQPTSHWVE